MTGHEACQHANTLAIAGRNKEAAEAYKAAAAIYRQEGNTMLAESMDEVAEGFLVEEKMKWKKS